MTTRPDLPTSTEPDTLTMNAATNIERKGKLHNPDMLNNSQDLMLPDDEKGKKNHTKTIYKEPPRHTTPPLGGPRAPAYLCFPATHDDPPADIPTTPLGPTQATTYHSLSAVHDDPLTEMHTTPTYAEEHIYEK